MKGYGLRTVLSGEQYPLGTALTFEEVEDAALLQKGTCVLWVGITMLSQLVGQSKGREGALTAFFCLWGMVPCPGSKSYQISQLAVIQT